MINTKITKEKKNVEESWEKLKHKRQKLFNTSIKIVVALSG